MKILVTGSAGFVGTRICDALQNQGHNIVSVVRQLPENNQVSVGDINSETKWHSILKDVDVVLAGSLLQHPASFVY